MWPVSLELPILWGQLDALGHLNNTVFFRFFEEARIVLFDRAQLRALRADTRQGPILGTATCRFMRPIHHPDTVVIETGVRSLGQTSFVLDYRLHSRSQNALAATGDSVVVFYDYDRGHKVPLPDDVRAALEALRAPELAP